MQKQIIAILVIASITFVLMLGGAFIVHETKPELLGFPPKPVDSTKVTTTKPLDVPKVDSVAIKIEQERTRLALERDSLRLLVTQIVDSLTKIKSSSDWNKIQLDELNLELSRQKTLAQKKQDTLKLNNLREFAQMYNNSNPKEVAQILDSIDAEEAAYILKSMKKKNAARVLNFMDKSKAKRMLEISSHDAGETSDLVQADTARGRRN